MTKNEDLENAREAIELYRQYKQHKIQLGGEQRRTEQDLELRWEKLNGEVEAERLQRLQGLSSQVLALAAKSPWQGELIARMSETETLKGLPPENVLAILSGKTPELARVVQEIMVKAHDRGALPELERMAETLKGQAEADREGYRLALDRFTAAIAELAARAPTITLHDSVAILHGQPVAGDMSPANKGNAVSGCAHDIPAGARFCPECGRKVF